MIRAPQVTSASAVSSGSGTFHMYDIIGCLLFPWVETPYLTVEYPASPRRGPKFPSSPALGRSRMAYASPPIRTTPSRAVSSPKSSLSRFVSGPGDPSPMPRPSISVTLASSPIVPVQNASSAR